MRRLTRDQRAQILTLQVEGNSVRAICRITGRSKGAVLRLIVDAGQACATALGELVRDVRCQRVQVDELWAFVGMKAKNVPAERREEFGVGDVWTFTAIDPDTKLMPSWLIGRRDVATARAFLLDVGRRIRGRFQLTTDAASFYREAAAAAFGPTIDYAQLQKLYSADVEGAHRYSPPACVATRARIIQGDPDPAHVSTSHVERQNLSMRMGMRRFTRLTNAFSKKVYNLSCAVAIYTFHYNYLRPHGTLTTRAHGTPTTPAMAAGLATRPWTVDELVELIEHREPDARHITQRRFDRDTGYHGEPPSK